MLKGIGLCSFDTEEVPIDFQLRANLEQPESVCFDLAVTDLAKLV